MGGFTFTPFSDVALHHMGPGLADFINQGAPTRVACPGRFPLRTACGATPKPMR
jgi:hypothetical protein